MKETWLVWLLLAFSCAKRPEPEARTAKRALAPEVGEVEDLCREDAGETGGWTPIVTDDLLYFCVDEVEEMAARMRAEGVSDGDAQLRACIAEEELMPVPDEAELTGEERFRLSSLVERAEGPGREEAVRELASMSGRAPFRKETLRSLARLLRRNVEPLAVIAAMEERLEGLSPAEVPNDLVPTLLGHAGLFHLYDARVRLAAARVLGKLRAPRAGPFLRRAKASYADEGLVREIEKALRASSNAAR